MFVCPGISSHLCRNTFFISPHETGLLFLLPAGPARVTGNQIHVCTTVQQELHQADVTVETGTV